MRGRLLTLIGILSPAIMVVSATMHAQTSTAIERTWTPPRTAWGDPGLRGVWYYATIPLERGRDTIEYRFTVEDPTIWTQSWTAVIPMHATAGPIFEFACHEGNARSIEGILGSARDEEKRPDR